MTVDVYLHPFEALFAGLDDLDADLVDEELGVRMLLEEATVDTPIELDASVDEQGRVVLASAPPTQHVETTWMPVFHRLRLRVTADEPG